MWILVYIVIQPFVSGDVNSYQPYAVNPMGPRVTFESMTDCFKARDNLSGTIGKGNGYFNLGQQSVCIQLESTDI
jgi:hypothetical protein